MTTTDAAGPSPREIIDDCLELDYGLENGEPDKAGAIIAALESVGYRIVPVEQRAGVEIPLEDAEALCHAANQAIQKFSRYGPWDNHVRRWTEAVMATQTLLANRATGDGEKETTNG
jgi:hypothetical protein